ncbi:MAG: FkbM family methyltransferase [Bacteroidia bacterium]|jgi:FkbM family methyltransferase
MEKIIRSLLIRILGFPQYLRLVSHIYLRLVFAGFLRKKYPELFHLSQLIKPGFVCIDIGANVGYYSSFMSKYAGPSGHIYAVEPVSLFAEIFAANTKRFGIGNITLHQTALGGTDGEVIMGTPVIQGVVRHGLTRVLDASETAGMRTYKVPLQVPDKLFANLQQLDFIKCDVEGYEVHLFPHLMQTIHRFRPLIQVEISTLENRRILFDLFSSENYKIARLNEGKLIVMNPEEALNYNTGDFYLLP